MVKLYLSNLKSPQQMKKINNFLLLTILLALFVACNKKVQR